MQYKQLMLMLILSLSSSIHTMCCVVVGLGLHGLLDGRCILHATRRHDRHLSQRLPRRQTPYPQEALPSAASGLCARVDQVDCIIDERRQRTLHDTCDPSVVTRDANDHELSASVEFWHRGNGRGRTSDANHSESSWSNANAFNVSTLDGLAGSWN